MNMKYEEFEECVNTFCCILYIEFRKKRAVYTPDTMLDKKKKHYCALIHGFTYIILCYKLFIH